ncbi:MAG: hypothetical protein IJ789_02230 [Bacteroidales bacterium]|nr:hypothetical protein [Bacteroidales bacterium]
MRRRLFIFSLLVCFSTFVFAQANGPVLQFGQTQIEPGMVVAVDDDHIAMYLVDYGAHIKSLGILDVSAYTTWNSSTIISPNAIQLPDNINVTKMFVCENKLFFCGSKATTAGSRRSYYGYVDVASGNFVGLITINDVGDYEIASDIVAYKNTTTNNIDVALVVWKQNFQSYGLTRVADATTPSPTASVCDIPYSNRLSNLTVTDKYVLTVITGAPHLLYYGKDDAVTSSVNVMNMALPYYLANHDVSSVALNGDEVAFAYYAYNMSGSVSHKINIFKYDMQGGSTNTIGAIDVNDKIMPPKLKFAQGRQLLSLLFPEGGPNLPEQVSVCAVMDIAAPAMVSLCYHSGDIPAYSAHDLFLGTCCVMAGHNKWSIFDMNAVIPPLTVSTPFLTGCYTTNICPLRTGYPTSILPATTLSSRTVSVTIDTSLATPTPILLSLTCY